MKIARGELLRAEGETVNGRPEDQRESRVHEIPLMVVARNRPPRERTGPVDVRERERQGVLLDRCPSPLDSQVVEEPGGATLDLQIAQRVLPQVRNLFRPGAREALKALRRVLETGPAAFPESLALLEEIEGREGVDDLFDRGSEE
jgi:hypothetical protein